MNKFKALLIAGLLSLSSVSFASSVSYIYEAGYAGNNVGEFGTISLNNGDGGVTVGGIFNSTGSVYYDMSLDAGTVASIGQSFDITTGTLFDVTISVFDSLAFDAASLIATGVNSISADLIGGSDYFLQFTGVTDTSYNVDVAAVPVPAAGILFASALFGAGALGRRKKKSAKTSMVGAFTRAS